MIKLHQFPTAWDLPNPSPFCWKVEAYLRMAELPFETVAFGDPRKAPKGKLPFIDDGGTVVADSSAILGYLGKKHGDPLGDAALGPDDRARTHALRRMTEEHFYWVLLYSRWIDAGWAHTRDYLRAGFPPVLRSVLPGVFQGVIKKQLAAQGVGRHGRDEIYALGRADLDAMAAILGDKPYFLGDAPRAIDATMTAFLGSALLPPFTTPMKEHAQTHPNLVRYAERMHARYFAPIHSTSAAAR